MELLILVALVGGIMLWVFGCTKAEDWSIVERGEGLNAPDWARWLFVLIIGGVLCAVLIPGIMSGLGN